MADGMNIVANFNIDDIIRNVNEDIAAIIKEIVAAMELACRETVKAARLLPQPPPTKDPHQPNYIDHTGYLRGSIGFAIYYNGTLVAEDFAGTENGNAGENAPQGQVAGRTLSKQIAGQYTDGIVAIVVCGAEYAAAVESKGYDVLTGSAKELGNIFKQYIAEVKAKHGL